VHVETPGDPPDPSVQVPKTSPEVEDSVTVPDGFGFVPAASTSVTVTRDPSADCPASAGLGDTATEVVVPRLLT
jgi:hypothetical protein